MGQDERTLTDADINALADKVVQKMEDRFYIRLGKAMFAIITGMVLAVLGWEKITGKG
jgi:hypothetical protein